jgi:threonine/homoserine/homoserine lactone efflux protein
MVTWHQVAAVAVATGLLIVIPGPSVLFIIGRALTHGRRVAVGSVIGNTTGCLLVAVLIAFGLGEVLQRSETAFLAIKFAGAAYLVWLGVQALRNRRHLVQTDAAPAPPSVRIAMRTGLIVGLTNPKAFVIMAAIVPQFVNRDAGHVSTQLLLLALVPLAIGLVTDSMWAFAAGTARDVLVTRADRVRTLGRVGGLCMIGLGVTVAATGNPG